MVVVVVGVAGDGGVVIVMARVFQFATSNLQIEKKGKQIDLRK